MMSAAKTKVVSRTMVECDGCSTRYERVVVDWGTGCGSSSCPRCRNASFRNPFESQPMDLDIPPDVVIVFDTEGGFRRL